MLCLLRGLLAGVLSLSTLLLLLLLIFRSGGTGRANGRDMAARLLPLELIDKCIGSRLWIIMKGDKVRR